MSYSIPEGSDPLTTRVTNPSTARLGSGGLIATQNASNPSQLSRIILKDSWAEGGNFTVDLAPPDGFPPNGMEVRNCLFGIRHNYGPLRLPSGSVNSNNRWGQSGLTGGGQTVQVGDPL